MERHVETGVQLGVVVDVCVFECAEDEEQKRITLDGGNNGLWLSEV